MDILRFITAGSVDDGKSTLIGRLLYDSKSILSDQLQAIRRQSRKDSALEIDLALLTDGLRAEREQGITIDVAYKYFSTAKRKFIIADAPGHTQYTRNMVTGASTANLALILIDARNGIMEQTRRHSILASLLGIPHVVVCVNKMDLVDFSEDRFYEIVNNFRPIAGKLGLKDVYYVPVSARLGDHIVDRSPHMPWFTGKPLLPYLEELPLSSDINLEIARMPVQYVIRPQSRELHDYRGFAGKIISGSFHSGQAVRIYPGGEETTISRIETFDGILEQASAPLSVVLHLTDDLGVGRGDLIVPRDQPIHFGQDFQATICWMDTAPLKVGDRLILQHNCNSVRCSIREIPYRIDVGSLEQLPAGGSVGLNEIFCASIHTAKPIAWDQYQDNRANGGFILIQENTNVTVGAGMIL
ncbi:MAG TPA: GTP-binding protein [Chitinophagaceae bacterium]|nr:GTP-binding protein [Chitinophagaceae bacterium]